MPVAKNRLEELQVRKLIQCVRESNNGQIDKMIELGVPNIVNLQEPDKGQSALHVAVSLNYDAVVTQLLCYSANSAIQDLEGCTPVMRACEHGHLQSLEALAVKGLSLTTTDVSGRTAPFYCIHPTGRHVKCLSMLLEFGADPNSRSRDGIPLICAICDSGYDKLLDVLLRHGVDPDAKKAKDGKPAIVIATEGGHKECVRLLADAHADLNATYGDNGICAVHRAATLGHFEVLQVLSAYGADFTLSSSKTVENAAHFATIAYKLLCIRFIGQRGCPTNETNDEGNTPQKVAKIEGMKDAMKELKKLTSFQDKVAKGSKPKGYAEPWSIRLFDWFQCNKITVYTTLRDNGANVEGILPSDVFKQAMTDQNIPLIEEEWEKLIKIYDKKSEGFINWDELLTDHKYVHANYKLGPNDDIKGKKKKGKKKKGGKKGKKGKTKIHFPIYFEDTRAPIAGISDGCIEKQQYITDEHRFPRDSPPPHCYVDDSIWYLMPPDHRYIQIYEAVRHGDVSSILSAFSEGVEVDSRDKYNKTCLMIACAHGRVDMVKLLLDKGAEVNAIDNFMWTPLHHACHAGEEEVVRLLLEHGATIDYQSYNGGTPLMRAIESSQREIVQLLLQKGAKLNLANKHGNTAVDIARNWGDDYVYSLIYAKAANLPSLTTDDGKDKGKDKKAGGKGGSKKKGKKEAKNDSGPTTLPGPPLLPALPSPRLCTPFENLEETRKRLSFNSLRSEITVKPVPSYKPKPAWVSRPPTIKTFQDGQMVSRAERGTEAVDFEETKTHFQLQIIARAQALEISDE